MEDRTDIDNDISVKYLRISEKRARLDLVVSVFRLAKYRIFIHSIHSAKVG